MKLCELTENNNWKNCLNALKEVKHNISSVNLTEDGYPVYSDVDFMDEDSSRELQSLDWQRTLDILKEHNIEDNIDFDLDENGRIENFNNVAPSTPDYDKLRESMSQFKKSQDTVSQDTQQLNEDERPQVVCHGRNPALSDEDYFDDDDDDNQPLKESVQSVQEKYEPTYEEEKDFYNQNMNDLYSGIPDVDFGDDFDNL